MKKITFLFFTTLLLTLSACIKDDDTPVNPIDRLPEATQTGAQTFGCLLNGEAYLPTNYLDCVYEYATDGTNYFTLSGRRYKSGIYEAMSVATVNLAIVEGETYSLLENESGNARGAWFDPQIFNYVFTSHEHTGELTITRFDEDAHIVSGTFWFDIKLPDGELLEVREGRFDMNYSN